MPFGNQAVRGQRSVEGTGRDSVSVGDVSPSDGPEAHEIEIGILGYQRIESPLDEIDASCQCVCSLIELQPATDAGIAVRRQDGGHMGMEERFSCAPAADRQS